MGEGEREREGGGIRKKDGERRGDREMKYSRWLGERQDDS